MNNIDLITTINNDKNKDFLRNLIGYQLSKVLKLKRKLTDKDMQKLNLSRTQWLTLIWISILGSPCTQKELLTNLDIDAGHLTRILNELESRKYILRTIINNNRRCLRIEATDYYSETIEPKILAILEKENKIILSNFNDSEKNTLNRLLNKLDNNIYEALNSINALQKEIK